MPIYMNLQSSKFPNGNLKIALISFLEGTLNGGTFNSIGEYSSSPAYHPFQVTYSFENYEPTIWECVVAGTLLPAVQFVFEKVSSTGVVTTYMQINLGSVVLTKYEASASSNNPTITLEIEALTITRETFPAAGTTLASRAATGGIFVAWPPPC